MHVSFRMFAEVCYICYIGILVKLNSLVMKLTGMCLYVAVERVFRLFHRVYMYLFSSNKSTN